MCRYLPFFIIPFFISCAASKNYNPNKKYAPQELQEDFTVLRNILEAKHPSLYWYTPKDSMDQVFKEGYQHITDSMTELQFGWRVLAPLTSAIHCGHTNFSMSKNWHRFLRDKRIPSFPLLVKVWKDSMMVMGNLHRNDSLIKRGDFIHAINGIKNSDAIQTMLGYMVADGYANNVNYIRLSSSFPYFHRNIFGLYKNYFINFSDSNGIEKQALIPLYSPVSDSGKKRKRELKHFRKKLTRKEKLARIRNIEYDSTFAIMTVNSFSKGHLKNFFRKSFREIKNRNLGNLIIDLRANGGGDINKSVSLTKYIRNTPFKVADSAYAISRNFKPYTKYISSGFWNNLGLFFVANKRKDGNYHFGYWDKHTFMPKRKKHFKGKVFVLTNGLTFSASSLFCNAVKGQENVKLVGEETGGGWYGNSGIMIPQIILPNTGLRVRLPFFRLVQYNHIPVKGSGIIPDIFVGTDWRDLLNGVDTKLKLVKRLITEN